MPVYNTERYLAECLGSIVGQKVDFDMEVVVVNDGSSDGSLNVIKNFAAKDARIRVIDQANRGFSGARNVAIDAIRGGVLCFVDSDDALAPATFKPCGTNFSVPTQTGFLPVTARSPRTDVTSGLRSACERMEVRGPVCTVGICGRMCVSPRASGSRIRL